MSRVVRTAWLVGDLGVSPAAFYLTQAAGIGVVRSLVTATVVAALWVLAGALRTRRMDALAATMLGTYALMLAMAAATEDARLVLLRDPVISAVAGMLFLGSCLAGKPATAYLAQRLHGENRRDTGYLRSHGRQTLVWGVTLTAEALVRVCLVFLLPIPVVAGLSPTVELVLLTLLAAWTFWYRKRERTRQSAFLATDFETSR
ncbi:VC0807 family protein [Nocardia brasiliensis]|uniref:VC0807 family protein n=1 Tax=Nocardia brasiliensis TaxID=37326 RepID=UPI0024576EBB|nr:VC0807 family protein [Nocardia brasiliensis]